jgi:hypothetical protein
VLRPDAQGKEAGWNPPQQRPTRQHASRQRRALEPLRPKGWRDHIVLDHQLQPLGYAGRPLAAFLNETKRIETNRAFRKPRGKNVASSDGILHRKVYADPAYRRHRMSRITDAQKARLAPAFQPVDFYREQLDIVPGSDLGHSI